MASWRDSKQAASHLIRQAFLPRPKEQEASHRTGNGADMEVPRAPGRPTIRSPPWIDVCVYRSLRLGNCWGKERAFDLDPDWNPIEVRFR